MKLGSLQTILLTTVSAGVIGMTPMVMNQANTPQKAVAVMIPTNTSSTGGVIEFMQTPNGVRVVGYISGLKPNSKHGFHIHEFGDLRSGDGMSLGGHYNPASHQHGLPHQEHRHAGDLGNLEADSRGKAHIDKVFQGFSIGGASNPILGRGLVIHELPDDGGQPVGNAGGRISVGVIGVAQTKTAN